MSWNKKEPRERKISRGFAYPLRDAHRGGALPRPAECNCEFVCTDAKRYAPVGADASVRPAARTHEHGRTNANTHTVCRGRCPHRPARRTPVFTIRCGKTVVPIGRTEASAPTGRCAFSLKMHTILRLHSAGSMWASTPTDRLRCRCSLCEFVGAPCAGGVEPLPYGVTGNIAFLRYAAANLPLPNGRTEASAPTRTLRVQYSSFICCSLCA